MSAPGDIMSGHREVWIDGRYHQQVCSVVVLATSRHKRRISDDEGAAILGVPFSGCEQVQWWSVTQAEVNEGHFPCDNQCDAGAWCCAGSGKAWVLALYPPLSLESEKPE